MDSQVTLLEFLLQHRSTIIDFVSIAVGVIIFLILQRRLMAYAVVKEAYAEAFGELLTLGGSGGRTANWDMRVIYAIVAGIGNLARSRRALISFAATVLLALVCGYIFLYAADAGTKRFIETQLTFPAPLCERKTRDSVLVFIHGWNGDVNETWQQFPKLACDDPRLSHTDIISVGYPTYMKQSGFPIVVTASWIYERLVDRPDFRDSDKVVIIAHSMGGLIAREIALMAPTSKIRLHIVGIITIASPHNGADVSSIADALGISSHLTSDMKRGSHMLESLQTRWNDADPKYRPSLVCFGGVVDQVVQTDSAFDQCGQRFKVQQWSHSELVKPASREDERYRRPMNHVVNALQAVEPNTAGSGRSKPAESLTKDQQINSAIDPKLDHLITLKRHSPVFLFGGHWRLVLDNTFMALRSANLTLYVGDERKSLALYADRRELLLLGGKEFFFDLVSLDEASAELLITPKKP
jgi:pimeloyl-ACP methyl ester carboxylesterase